MSYRIKVPPRKSPVDETQLMSTMERVWLAAEEHRRGLIAGLLVVLLAIGVIVGVVWYDMRQSEKALALHVEANKFYATRPADRPEQAQKNLRKAIALYRDVVKQYPRTAAAAHALYRMGIALEEDKNPAEAAEAYQKLVTLYGDNGAMAGLAYQRLGYLHLSQSRPEAAEEAFASVLAVPGALNKDQALFELGKLEEAQSRPEGALAHYQELMDRYPYSPLANEVSIRIKALSATQAPAEAGAQSGGEEPPAARKEPEGSSSE